MEKGCGTREPPSKEKSKTGPTQRQRSNAPPANRVDRSGTDTEKSPMKQASSHALTAGSRGAPNRIARRFRQTVEAIHKVFERGGIARFPDVDWALWRDSDRGLQEGGPTWPEATRDLRRRQPMNPPAVRAAVRPVGFAITTAQAYLHWSLHFIRFRDHRNPSHWTTADIAPVLDD